MGKSEKSAFILITALLVLLIGFILVRALTSHDAVRVYRVSIITDDVQGDYSANVLKGLDRAARDYNIDLQVIALHSGMTTEQQKNSLERELAFLSVHGALHLLGYDHMQPDDEKKMFAKQDEILNELGYHR